MVIAGSNREDDVRDYATSGRQVLLKAGHDANPFVKWAARTLTVEHLTEKAAELHQNHGTMSAGREALVRARAVATLSGDHEVADALLREMAGVR